jgi:hypothetical protein
MKLLCNVAQMLPVSGWTLTGSDLASGSVGFWTSTRPTGNGWWLDDVRIRKYVDAEPTTSLGTEDRV